MESRPAAQSRRAPTSTRALVVVGVLAACFAPSLGATAQGKTARTGAQDRAHAPRPKVPISPKNASVLLAHFRALPGLEARFVETKKMALLAVPLVSSGTLAFSPPGLLARHTLKPAKTSVIIQPERVRMFDGHRWQAIDLKANPVVRRFVEGFVTLLKGDEAGLKRRYAVEYSRSTDKKGQPKGWRLKLRPRRAPLNKVIKVLELAGSALQVATMRLVERDGDETLTTFSAVRPGRRFSTAEKNRIFHLRAP